MVDKTFIAIEVEVIASACPLATLSCYQLGHPTYQIRVTSHIMDEFILHR